MRKTLMGPGTPGKPSLQDGWLELDSLASVEVSSETPECPGESVFADPNGERTNWGWRASSPGQQSLRLVFDPPRSVSRVELSFEESESERTQEFSLRWSGADGASSEIVRQQFAFSPGGATQETEDYRVELESVQALEITIRPDLQADSPAIATLARWRIA